MTSSESSNSGCWPDDPDYLDGRVLISSSARGDEEVGCYFDAEILDVAGHPLPNRIDVGEPFQIRFRVETQPPERWVDASGTWSFDLAFSPIGSGSGFNLSGLLPPGTTQLESWRGEKTPCIEVAAAVPPGSLPGSRGTYAVGATVEFQPTGGSIGPISGMEALETYSLLPSSLGLEDQVEWQSDAPAREDRLRRQRLAGALATRLRRFAKDDPGTSYLIHIDGPWGSGKTTLLRMLQQELEQEQGQEPKWPRTIETNQPRET
jgi:KAP family P-loop domain